MDEQRGIGKNGTLPWHLPADLKHFKDITTRVAAPGRMNAVVMGRKTWESLPDKFRPLPARVNVVLTSSKDMQVPTGVLVSGSFDLALKALETDERVGDIFVIGGAQLFTQVIGHAQCVKLHVTFVHGKFACDVFFPAFPQRFKEIGRSPIFSGPAPSYCFVELAV